MNSKKSKIFILLFLILVLLTGCSIFGPKETIGLSLRIEPGDDLEYVAINDTLDYYYSVFNERERKIYRIFCDMMEHFNEDGYVCELIVPADIYNDAFVSEITTAFLGCGRDHPEYFPLSSDAVYNQLISTIMVNDDERNEYILRFIQEKKYPDYEKERKELDKAVDDFLKDIDLTADKDEIALEIHDKLIDMVDYGLETNYGNEGKESSVVDYASCAYGALVKDRAGCRNAICTGYSAAYEYLLKKAGIMCSTITGYACMVKRDGSENEGLYHIWNVYYNGEKWKEVDVQLDDCGPNDIEISNEEYIEIYSKADEKLADLYKHMHFGLNHDEMAFTEITFDYSFLNGIKKEIHIATKHIRINELKDEGKELPWRQEHDSLLSKFIPED